MLRNLASVTAALYAFAMASSTMAEPTKKIAFRLDYQPPEDAGCPTAEELAYTLAGEFGYLVVREDARVLVRVDVQKIGDAMEAVVWAPDLRGENEVWHGRTDAQFTCRELSYDIASLLGAHLGPKGWPTNEPPAMLLAPPDVELRLPVIRPVAPRRPEKRTYFVPPLPPMDVGLYGKDAPWFLSQVGVFAMVMPFGLTNVGLGGGGGFFARWTKFMLGGEMRAFGTPVSGIGDPPQPGRTMLMGASLLPCAIIGPVDLCGVAGVSKLNFDLPPAIQLSNGTGVSGDFGGRLIGRWKLDERFTLAGYAEATAELRQISLRVVDTAGNGPAYNWTSPAARVVLGFGMFISVL